MDALTTNRNLRHRGSALTEFLVTLPILLLLGLGTWQSALVYNAKNTLNYATFEAARAGAVEHAQTNAMRTELGLRLAPLYGGDGSAGKAMAALALASLDVLNPLSTQIEIINPTREAFSDFGTEIVNPSTGEIKFGIPNGQLRYRDRTIKSSSGVNIQDANLLKIKTTYGYELKVPLMSQVIPAVMRQIDPQNRHFYDLGRLPITAVATVRMQSNAWPDDNAYVSGEAGSGGVSGGAEPETPAPEPSIPDNDGEGGEPVIIDNGGGHSQPCEIIDGVLECGEPEDQNNGNGESCEVENTANNNSSLPNLQIGNPIHVVTGNKYQQETDLPALPGQLGLSFSRHYNSQTKTQGVLGYNWRHDYEHQLNYHKTSNHYQLKQGDGRTIVFKPSPQNEQDGQYLAARFSDGWLSVNSSQNNAQTNAQNKTLHWHLRDGRIFRYTQTGQLRSITSADGKTQTLQYNPQGQLFLIRDPQQRELAFSYYPNGRLKQIIDPAGQTTHYRYDDNGNLSHVRSFDDSEKHYHYEDSRHLHALTGITDQRGIRYASYTYDEQGRAIESSHINDVGKVTLDFSTPNQTRITDSLGKESLYTTEERNGIALVTRIDGPGCSSCGNGDVQYKYNDQLQLTQITQKSGQSTHYVYDQQGRTLNVSQSTLNKEGNRVEQLMARYEYDGHLPRPVLVARPSVNPAGEHRTQIRYNAQQQPVEITEHGYRPEPGNQGSYTAIERTTKLSYTHGNLTQIDGPREDVNDIQSIEWNALNQVKSIHYPNGLVEKFLEYDQYGNATKIQLTNNAVIDLGYDKNANLITMSLNGQLLVQQQYNANNQLLSKKLNNSEPVYYEYDQALRLVKQSNKTFTKIFQWHTDGRAKQVMWLKEDQPFSAIHYEYDALNRLIAKKNLAGQVVKTYQYQNNNQKVARTQQGDFVTQYEYDAFNVLASVQNSDQLIRFSHPTNKSLPTELVDGRGNSTHYAIDDFGLPAYTLSPDTGLVQFAYNAVGKLIAKTDANKESVSLTYNQKDQNTQVVFSNDNEINFQYQDNKPTQITAKNETEQEIETREYDNEQGVIKKVTQSYNNRSYDTLYRYNQNNQLSHKTLPDGQTLIYQYYEQGAQTGQLKSIAYEGFLFNKPILKRQVIQDKNQTSVEYSYANNNQTRYTKTAGKLSHIATTNLPEYQYLYNNQQQIIGIDQDSQVYTRYRYDHKGQLDFALTPQALYGYQYDQNGNRTAKIVNGQHQKYHYNKSNNHLIHTHTDQAQLALSYRPDGSLQTINDHRIEYNINGQPKAIYKADNPQPFVTYRYNSKAERISKTVYDHENEEGQEGQENQESRQSTKGYLYENSQLSAELDEQGNITRQYLYDGQLPIAFLEKGVSYAIHNNHLGAPIAVSDPKGTLIWKASYSPFGKAWVEEDPDKDGQTLRFNIRLPGQYEDRETGYYYNYYRYYDPLAGRYISSDPLGLRAGANTYAYVKNDPVHHIDPLGLLLFAFDGTNNTDDQNRLDESKSQISNVVRFREAYDGDTGGVAVVQETRNGNNFSNKASNFYYVTGVGQDDPASGINAPFSDAAFGNTMLDRVDYMTDLLLQHLDSMRNQEIVDTTLAIDVVGYSRGAAAARQFANEVDDFIQLARQPQKTRDEYLALGREFYPATDSAAVELGIIPPGAAPPNARQEQRANRYADIFSYFTSPCNGVNMDLNFIGLWDTVPHHFRQANDVLDLQLGIPSSANVVSHAVAANEHREDFAMISIHHSADSANRDTRTEQSFIGAHADIGGGYGEGDLSDVAFMWMVEQSNKADVFVDNAVIEDRDWDIVTAPIVHDSVGVVAIGPFTMQGPDRDVRYLNNRTEKQKDFSGGDMSSAEGEGYFDERFMRRVDYRPELFKSKDVQGNRTLVGLVGIDENPNADTYRKWLKDNYGLEFDRFDYSTLE